jgi:signal transduction histidine kinase
LLLVADRERTRLDQLLRDGPEVLLNELEAILSALPDATLASADASGHIARAQSHLKLVREELRDLSAGLMPRELATGLEAALRALGDRLPAPVSVDVQVGPLPPETSRGAYFICSEALTNAVKHASASEVVLRVRQAGDQLVLEVSDDGVGGVSVEGGFGVVGLVDRAEALGGAVRWTSSDNGGTTVVATLPLHLPRATRESV